MMNERPEDTWSDPAGVDLLAETLRGMSRAPRPGSPTGPEALLPMIHRRIRTRRAAKKAALGTGSLMVATLVAVAVVSTPWDRPDPLPGVSPTAVPSPSAPSTTPTPSPTPTPSSSTAPSGNAMTDAVFLDGLNPGEWGSNFDVTCGMPIDDLVAQSSSAGIRMEVTGPAGQYDDAVEVPVRITETAGRSGEYSSGYPLLVWVQDGRVVDLGFGWHEGGAWFYGPDGDGRNGLRDSDGDGNTDGPHITTLGAGEAVEVVASAGFETSCGDYTIVGTGNAFEHALTPRVGGTYEVRAVTWFQRNDEPAAQLVLSDPLSVTVPDQAADPAPFAPGHNPEFLPLADAGIVCGSPAADLPSSKPDLELTITGDPFLERPFLRVPVELAGIEGGSGQWSDPTIVWLQDGVVVDVGSGSPAQPGSSEPATLEPGDRVETTATGSVVTTCAPTTIYPFYRTYRPAGTYQMVAVLPLRGADEGRFVVSEPVTVTIGEHGQP
ncbi:hypothetical protein L1785_01120 [Antribacter sp. KLBMP9083]|uniref:Uncharacterized protein n=1 Tax=Antribacter soli TaxID=2910976 RepID=A0AA41U524_9MICO|nr:hypothetical protein [Antribacter soli]MCF4119578.1 hypothetical protein [Antribacter soli]